MYFNLKSKKALKSHTKNVPNWKIKFSVFFGFPGFWSAKCQKPLFRCFPVNLRTITFRSICNLIGFEGMRSWSSPQKGKWSLELWSGIALYQEVTESKEKRIRTHQRILHKVVWLCILESRCFNFFSNYRGALNKKNFSSKVGLFVFQLSHLADEKFGWN